jgi:hypothetical protein
MAISNPITGQGIVDRFEELVTDVANTGIVWGISNKPFTEMPDANYSLESTILGQQNITSPGSITTTVPTGANAIHIIAAVGGGSGGVMGADYDKAGGESAGAGGASGAYISDKVFSVTAGETLTLVVGAGGAPGGGTGYSSTAGNGGNTTASGSTSGALFTLTGGTGGSGTGATVFGPLRTNTSSVAGTATISGTVRTSNTFVETDGTTININTLNGGPVGTFNSHGNGQAGTNPGNCSGDNCTITGGSGGASYNGTISGGAGGVPSSSNGGNGTRGSGAGGGGASNVTLGGTGGDGEIRYRFLAVS